MPIAKIQLPDGRIAKFDVPDGTSQEQVMAFVQQQLAPKAPQEPAYDPTADMSTTQKVLAGVGKAFTDIGRGAGQLVGLTDQSAIDEAKRLDQPLMKTGAGATGNLLGNVAIAAPAAFIPGANTLAGAGLAGAAYGALQPVASDEGGVVEGKLKNTAMGGALGSGATLAGRGLVAGAKTLKALTEPFTKGGQNTIVGRTLNRFAGDKADEVIAAAQAAKSSIPGVQPTLAEAALNPGISQLSRSPVTELTSALTERGIKNNAARLEALREIAGDAGKMDFFTAMRDTTADKLYKAAFKQGIKPKALTPKVQGQVAELMQNPAIQDAMPVAQRLAKFDGIDLADPAGSLNGMHYLKKALDDILDKGKQTGIGKIEARKIAETKDALLGVMDRLSPKYKEARQVYEAMSKPIAQMKVGQEFYNKAAPALTDYGMPAEVRAGAFSQALRNADQTAKTATGFKKATLDGVMSKEQIAMLNEIAKDMAKASQAQSLAKGVGSNTAQNLASENILRQLMGPLGMPQSWMESQALPSLLRAPQFVLKGQEPAIQAKLAEAMLDPQMAAMLMQANRVPWQPNLLLGGASRSMMPLSLGLLGANSAQQ